MLNKRSTIFLAISLFLLTSLFAESIEKQKLTPVRTFESEGAVVLNTADGILLSEGFEGEEQGWSTIDNDGNTFTWGIYDETVISEDAAHTGSFGAGVYYNGAGNDDWLISPQIIIPAGETVSLSFWALSSASNYLEDFNLKLSTTGFSMADFSTTLGEVRAVPGTWTQYTYDLTAYAGQSVYFAVQCVSVDEWALFVDDFEVSYPEANEIAIGSGDITGTPLPVEAFYNYSYAQSIYLNSEIGEAVQINEIRYHYNGAEAWGDPITIYMGETNKTEFVNGEDWIPISGLTQVYDGNLTVEASQGMVSLILDTPFSYSYTGNLVVAVDRNAGSFHDSNSEFFCSTTSNIRSISHYNDETNMDPEILGFSGNIYANIPNIILGIQGETAAPVADFSANVLSGVAPLTVQFTDASTGSPTSWSWDFNSDGTKDASVQNPSYTFTEAGSYYVSLSVSNGTGTDTETKADYIIVLSPTSLTADFEADVIEGSTPLTVNFTDLSTGGPTSWSWDFNSDGTEDASVQNPSYTFTEAGSYDVGLTVSNGDGTDTETKSSYITVTDGTISDDTEITIKKGTPFESNKPIDPWYDYTYSQSIYTPNEVRVSGDILEIRWQYNSYEDFTDDINIYMGETDKASFVSGDDWIPVGSLTLVYSGPMNATTSTEWVSIALDTPFNYSHSQNLVIAVDENTSGRHSYNSHFYSCGYDDDDDDYRSISLPATTNIDPASPPTGTSVSISLPYTVLVIDTPPLVADISADVTSGTGPLTVQFTDATTGDPATWRWDFDNDGEIDDWTQSPSHTYTSPGTYSVKLIVTNYTGENTVTKADYITVTDPTIDPPDFEEFIITSSDGVDNDFFGYGMAIDGHYAVVGAYGDDDNYASYSGSAYVFFWDGSTWTEQAKLTASDAASNDSFGQIIDIAGDNIVIGTRNNEAAYVYHRTGTTWTEIQKLTGSDGEADDEFGASVCIEGNYLAVGAYGDDDNGSTAGAAYLFYYNGTTWVEQQKLIAGTADAFAKFGNSVSMNEDYLAVGAYQEDYTGNTNGMGAVYIYNNNGSAVWTENTTLYSDEPEEPNNSFGYAIDMSPSKLVVTCYKGNGKAYIFSENATVWTLEDTVVCDNDTHNGYGWNIALSNNYLAVGAKEDDDAGSHAGAAYLYNFDGTDWNLTEKMIPESVIEGNQFGSSVAMDETHLIVGAMYGGEDDGSAYIYTLSAAVTPLVADFSATPLYGTAPLEVEFTDQSVGATLWS